MKAVIVATIGTVVWGMVANARSRGAGCDNQKAGAEEQWGAQSSYFKYSYHPGRSWGFHLILISQNGIWTVKCIL